MASSSFTSSHFSHQWKYDVFLSFRGDTRYNFTCHLYDALRRKGLEIFIDSHQLKRGEEIRTSLFQAIQNSNVAVIIFSKDYVSSTWCLNELVKIIECHETHGQIVVPIFFHVDPSHIRKQCGFIGTSFSLHERDPNNSENLTKWREALTKAANLSGWDSNVIREETMLIDAIVKDILEKLKHPSPCGLEHLVGMKFRIRQIKELLAFNSSDVQILGIYGIGGIGKTTLIETIYSLICSDFEGCCFVPNVKVESKTSGLKKLLEHIISEILGEKDIIINTLKIGPAKYYIKRLRRMKILVALDDVRDPLQLASLIGDPCWFGPGSRIIITSRDKQVFEGSTKYLYEMKPLTSDEALQLFSRNAFKRLCPMNDYVELSDIVVRYAQGNPLALKVFGSYLCGKNKEEWQSELSKLSKIPKKTIQNMLKVSYDDLDEEEKDMFLHIACFFKGEYKEDAIHIFDSCGFSATIGIRDLVDKSLITISKDDELEMHDLLQEMGKEIVRQESKDPCRRTRLWDSKDICQVLTQTDGSHAVESISLDMSEIGHRDLSSDAFTRMPNLKFLKFYTSLDERTNGRSKLHLPQGLNYLPNEMRYLQWDAYPLKSLPVNFHPKNLFVLKLRTDLNFTIPPEASDFGSWRNLPNTDFELERPPPPVKTASTSHSKKLLNGSGLNLSSSPSSHINGYGMDLSRVGRKRRKDFFPNGSDDDCYLAVNSTSGQTPDIEIHQNEQQWLNDFSGTMKKARGPVTAAKTIYEDEIGFLIIISLPFMDPQRVKVCWRNTLTHGIIKVSCVSTSRMTFINRHDRTFKLTDKTSEHCPPGDFFREIPLRTRIPEDAHIEAYYDGPGSVLEIMVPNLQSED